MIKIFTHNDLDGLSCVLLVQLAFGVEEVEYEACNHDDIEEKFSSFLENEEKRHYDYCFVTDIAFKDDFAATVNEKLTNDKANFPATTMQIIDHHISTEGLNQYPWCHVEVCNKEGTKTCGTSLVYEYLKKLQPNNTWDSPLLATYVEKVRRYDIWDWQPLGDFEAKQLNDLFFILGKERFMADWLAKFKDPNATFGFDETQQLLLELRQNEIDRYIENRSEEMVVKELFGYQVGVLFATRFQSELGNTLAIAHPELDFIAMINVGGGVALRGVKDDINLATEIAAVLGGGGHAKACGFPVGEDIREMVIESVFKLPDAK